MNRKKRIWYPGASYHVMSRGNRRTGAAVKMRKDTIGHIDFTVYTIKQKEVLSMAVKAMNFKMDEIDINEMKQVASVYHMTVTDVIKEAVREYVGKMKQDPFYKLTANVQEADKEESTEILDEIESLSDDDLSISSIEQVRV